MMLDDVAPLLQTKLDAPVAVSVVDEPAHIDEDDALTDTFGAAFTMIVMLEVTEQPLAFVPVTE
jgi:hypothetical protein